MAAARPDRPVGKVLHSISGLVAEYIVAIDVTRVRFPADAFHFGIAFGKHNNIGIYELARMRSVSWNPTRIRILDLPNGRCFKHKGLTPTYRDRATSARC